MAEETTIQETETPQSEQGTLPVNEVTGRPMVEDGIGNALRNPVTGRVMTNPSRSSLGVNIGLQKNVKLRDPLEAYGRYGVTLSPFLDLEEERAKRQSTGEKWSRGLTKALVTTGGAVVENTLGMVVGIGEAAVNWDGSKFFDNSVGRQIDKVNNYMQETMPNYYTQAEQNAQGLNALGYANFWADKAANGLGYSLGSIATIYLTGGTGLVGGLGKGAQIAGAALKLGKYSKAALAAARAVDTGADVAKAIKTGAKISSGLKRAAKAADIGMMMSWAESSVEARETMNGVADTYIAEYAASKGIRPEAVPETVKRRLRADAASAGNATFGMNLAVLSATNLITFGQHLFPKFIPRSKGPLARVGLDKAAGKAVDKLAKDPRWLKMAQKYLAPSVSGGVSEGFQEATQFAISEAATLRATDPEFANDWFKAINKGYGDAYNTKEGFDNTLVGVIVGMLTGGLGSVQTAINKGQTAEDQQVNKAVEMINNSPLMQKMIERGQHANEIAGHVADMNAALQTRARDEKGRFTGRPGKHKAYADAQFKALRAEALMHAEMGTMDIFLERLDMEKEKTEEQFIQDNLGEGESLKGQDKNDLIDAVKRKAEQLQEMHDNIESKFPATERTQGAARLFMSKEKKNEEAEIIADETLYKRMLFNNSADLTNIDGRVDNLANEINKADPEGSGNIQDILNNREIFSAVVGDPLQPVEVGTRDVSGNVVAPVTTQEQLDKLNESLLRINETNPVLREEIKEKMQDLLGLSLDRRKAVEALNNLSAVPEVRDAYVLREKSRAEQAKQDKIDQAIREDINETVKESDLADVDASNASPAMQEEIAQVKRERNEAEAKIRQEIGAMTPAAIEELLKEEEDPVRKSIMQDEVKQAKEEGRTTARLEPVGGEVMDLTDSEEQAADAEAAEMIAEATEAEQAQKDADEIAADKEAAAAQAEQGIDNSRDIDNAKAGIVINAGDFTLDRSQGIGKYKITVNNQNNPSKGRIEYDERLFENNDVQLNREPLFKPGLENKIATFELLKDGKTIAIKVGNDYIGLVRNVSADYSTLLKRLETGEKITAEITGRDFNNPNNMVDEQGNQKFISVQEAFEKSEEQPILGIIRGREVVDEETGERTKQTYIDTGKVDQDGEIVPFDESQLNEITNINGDSLKPGTVYIILKQPDGKYRPAAASARTIGQSSIAYQTAHGLLKSNKDGAASKLESLVGLGPRLNIGTSDIDGVLSNYILVKDETGVVYRMYTDQFAKSEEENVKFSVGNYDEAGNFEVVKDGDPKDTKIVTDLIKNNLKSSKFQIDTRLINVDGMFISPIDDSTQYDNYLDYLSDATLMENTNDVGPLAVDFKAMDRTYGEFFHDIGVTMEYNATDGKLEEATRDAVNEETPVAPIEENAVPADTVEDVEIEVLPEVIEDNPIETEPAPQVETTLSALDRVGNARVFEEARDVGVAKVLNTIKSLVEQNQPLDAGMLFGDPESTEGTAGEGSMIAEWFRDEAAKTEDPQRKAYLQEVYDTWFSTYDATGMEQDRGMRADVLDRLEEFGYTVREKSDTKILVEDVGVVYQRIYNKGRLEENPYKKLTDKVKRLLGRIPVSTDVKNTGVFGYDTFVPVADIYAAVLGATYNSKNSVEMAEKLRQLPASHPAAGVSQFVSSLNNQQKSLLFNNFGSLGLTEFVIIDPALSTETAERSARTFDANSQSSTSFFKKKWKSEAGQTLYTVTKDALDNDVFRLSPEKAATIKEGISKLKKDSTNTVENANVLADLLMDMGMSIAPTREEARERVRSQVLSGNVDISRLISAPRTQLTTLAALHSNPTRRNNKGDDIGHVNLFETEKKTIDRVIRDFVEPFESAPATSFNMGGKLIYPINARTEINNLQNRIKDGTQAVEMLGKDGVSIKGQIVGISAKLLTSPKFKGKFKFTDLGILKGEQNKAYDELNQEDVMVVVMSQFHNGGQDTSNVALTTQADRKRMTFHTFPKVSNRNGKGFKALGLVSNETATLIIKNEIILDMHRAYKAKRYIDKAKTNNDPLIEGYHTKEWFKRMNLPGLKYNEKRAQAIYNHYEYGDPISNEILEGLGEDVNKALSTIKGEIKDANPNLEGLLKSKLGADVFSNYGNLDNFLEDFILTDVLGKKVSNQMLRNGTSNWTKDGRTFIKRANLVTTPGGMLNITVAGEYGADPTFTTATVKDLTPEDLNGLAEKYGAAIEKGLISRGATPENAKKAAEDAIKKYRETNATDAQAFISIDHYRKIRQGQGEWMPSDQEVYEEYKAGQPWDVTRSPLVPMKPQYDTINNMGGSLSDINIPISDKNSYMILTRDLADGRPVLEDMLARMEGRDQYAGQTPINVINTESATKLGQIRPYKIVDNKLISTPETLFAGQFDQLHVMTLDTRGLRFPQDIGIKEETKTNLGKQPKKNQIANVDRNHSYTLNIGTGKATKVKGSKMLEIYHNAIERKVQNDLNELKNALGFTSEFFEQNKDQIVDSKFMVTLRNRLLDMAKERGLAENVIESMRLELDQAGNVMFGLPLSYPGFQTTFDSLLFSAFRRNVYKQKVDGLEMVQFAEFGAHEETGELKFLDVNEDGYVTHAEIEIGEAQMKAFGLDLPVGVDLDTTDVAEENKRMIAYRIPNASKSFMVTLKIKRVNKSGAQSAVRVPAQITTAMGSDFDIDKMFLMMPAQKKDGTGRIMPDYKSLSANPAQILDATYPAKAVNNIILDVMEAVAVDPIHAQEVLDPEGIRDIEAGLAAIGMSKEQRGDVDLFNPMTHITAAYENMLSMSLRGIYANSIAGRNIVTSTGQEITGPVTVTVDGKRLNAVTQNSAFPDVFGIIRPTDHYLKQYLSAAVDSVKDPLQNAANDNSKTAPLTVYLLSIGATPQQIIKFLNNPHVRKVTEAMQSKDENTPKKAFFFGSNKKENNTANLDITEETPTREIEDTLIALYKGANALQTTYSAVSVDNIDGAGTVAAHQAYFDKINAIREGQLDAYGGASFVEGVLTGDLYRYQAAYYGAMETAIDVANRAGMIGTQISVTGFKNFVKDLTGKGFLGIEEHKALNRIISHHLLTKQGSPLSESAYLTEDTLSIVHLSTDQNIIAGLSNMRQLPLIANLSIIKQLTPKETQYNAKNKFFSLEFNNAQGRTLAEQNKMQREWERMLNRPESFGYDAQTTIQIKNFAKDLITNSISTTGFITSPTSMFGMLPNSVMKEIGAGEYLAQEMVKVETTASALNDLKSRFLQDYGHMKLGKKPMFPVLDNAVSMVRGVPSPVLSIIPDKILKRKPFYIVATDGFGNSYVYERIETGISDGEGQKIVTYHRTETRGREGMLNEAGNDRSILYPNKNATPESMQPVQNKATLSREIDAILSREADPKAKISKLKAAFADAGIDVIVEEGSLPKGVKGQVDGDVVTFDPSQMTDDTAYHEFGHIIVDMLPKAEVEKYIAQVRKLRPDLVKQVEDAYAGDNLSEFEMGKEILVTAIGIEGANIEKNKPSAFRRLINRIMRAIGKLFGVQPDAAVVLAEKMFAGELRGLQLSGIFNSKVQRSRDMQTEVDNLYKTATISVNAEIRQLEMVPEATRDTEQVRRLKELKKNLKRLKENKNDIDAFMKIQEYVVLNVDRAKAMMNDLRNLSEREAPVGKKEALRVLQQVDVVRRIIDGVDGGGSLVRQTQVLLRDVVGEEGTEQRKKDILADLQEALIDAQELDNEYLKIAIPLAADSIVNYGSEEVNADLDNIIAAAKRNKDIAGIDKRDPEYSLIQVKHGRGELSDAQREKALLDLKIEQLSNKKLGRKQLIKEMTQAHVDKSAYSYQMDPLVYSSEQNLQLFALAYIDQMTKANEGSRKTIFDFQKVYDAFREAKGGGINVSEFNKPFLTEHNVKGQNLLFLVQEYDVNEFYKARTNAENSFKENNGWPKDKNGKFVARNSEAYKQWAMDETGKGSPAVRQYYRSRAAWYAENTQPVENADALFDENQKEQQKLKDQIAELEGSESAFDQDKLAVLKQELGELVKDAKWNKSNETYSGALARPSDKYRSKQWEAIQADPAKKAYYKAMVDRYHADQARGTKANLFTNAWDTFSYQMPAIRKDSADRVQEQGVFSGVKDQVVDSLTRQATDIEYGVFQEVDGQVQKGVPILYTNRVDAKDVSRDIAASLMQFHHMTNMFEAKAEMQGLVNTMLDIHARREVLETDPSTGSRILNKLSPGDAQVYRKGKGIDSNTFKHLQSFVDANFYGMYDIPQYIRGLGEANKIASSVSVLTALNTLSFNTLQAGNQAILDNLMTWEEAWAGQFFTRANYRAAIAEYAASGGAMSDLGKMAPTTKLGQAMQMFDALVEMTDGAGKNITGGKTKQAMSTDSFFVLQHAVEHQTSGVRMIALMKAMEGKLKDKSGKVINNKEGKPADLWDLLVMDEKGFLVVDPRVANFDQGKFVAKLNSVQKRTNQIKGRRDKSHFQRSALGKVMTLFRNYFQPQLRKRFGHGDGYHVDQEAGTVTRGMYLSALDYLKNMFTQGRFALSDYSETDQQNIRRAFFETSVVLATYAIGRALAGMMSDDDDDNYALRFFAYQAKRLNTEMLQFVNPKEAMRIIDSPTATANLLRKWTGLIDQGAAEVGYAIGITGEEDIFYQRKSGINEKGDRKIMHKIKRVLPVVDGMISTLTPEEKIKFLQK